MREGSIRNTRTHRATKCGHHATRIIFFLCYNPRYADTMHLGINICFHIHFFFFRHPAGAPAGSDNTKQGTHTGHQRKGGKHDRPTRQNQPQTPDSGKPQREARNTEPQTHEGHQRHKRPRNEPRTPSQQARPQAHPERTRQTANHQKKNEHQPY